MWIGVLCNSRSPLSNTSQSMLLEMATLRMRCLTVLTTASVWLFDWVVGHRHDVADSPMLQESCELPAGELGSSISPKTYGYSQVMEEVSEVTDGGSMSEPQTHHHM